MSEENINDVATELEAIAHGDTGFYGHEQAVLLAAVAEIRRLVEQVAEYEAIFDKQREREKPYVELWRQREKKPLTLPDYGSFLEFLLDMLDLGDEVNRQLSKQVKAVEPFLQHKYTMQEHQLRGSTWRGMARCTAETGGDCICGLTAALSAEDASHE